MSAVALAAGAASGHVAPSQGENNRYLKILPFADRVRIAYTVFYGEVPGHAWRRGLDTDGDGLISDAEAHAAGEALAARVAAGLELDLDGVRQPVVWDEISVGLGAPSVSAGAWSVDLIAWPCVGAGQRIQLRDRFELPLAGETELWVVDAPGVTIDRARVGDLDDPAHDFRMTGAPTALATDGLELRYTAGPGTGSAGPCSTGTPAAGHRLWAIAAAVSGVVLGLGALAWSRRRRAV